MKLKIAALFLSIFVAGNVAFANSSCFVGCSKPKSLIEQLQVGGWITAGITANAHGSKNEYAAKDNPTDTNLQANSGNSSLLGLEHQSDLKVNQAWLFVHKPLNTKHGFDWGFRVDGLFGTDARFAQNFGDQSLDYGSGTGDYGWAFAQMYAELGYENVKLKVGQFGSPMAWEPFVSPFNPFYSHSYSCYNVPLHFTGAMLEVALSQKLTVSGGWTAGTHSGFDNRFGDNGFLGIINYKAACNVSVAYYCFYGQFNGLNKLADANTQFFRYYDDMSQIVQSLDVIWNVNKKLMSVTEFLWSDSDYNWSIGANAHDYKAKTYGISQRLVYTFNPKWNVAGRIEWMNTQNGMFDFRQPTAQTDGIDLYEMTLAINWFPNKHFNLRPEIRYDWTHEGTGPFNGGTEKTQLSGGCAAILKF